MLRSGEPVQCRGSKVASSEAETRSGSGSLERGGNSPEEASGPGARRRFTRGASSPRARRRFRGATPGPRARWSFARGAPWLAIWWAAEAFLVVGLPLPWAATTWGVICGCRLVRLLLLFLKKG
jgi:hypothetical protein